MAGQILGHTQTQTTARHSHGPRAEGVGADCRIAQTGRGQIGTALRWQKGRSCSSVGFANSKVAAV